MFLHIQLFLIVFHYSYSAKILCLFSTPAPSHQAVYRPIYQELSTRGHQVTVLTPSAMKNPNLINLTEIELPGIYEIAKTYDTSKISRDRRLLQILMYIAEFQIKYGEEILKNIQNIFQNYETNFDLLIVENISPVLYSIVCRFKAPIIGISSGFVPSYNHDIIGNSNHPVLYPDLPTRLEGKMSFFEKMSSIINNILFKLIYYGYYLPRIDKTGKKYLGNNCPYIEDIIKNISLIVANTSPLLYEPRANIPTFVALNGLIHLQPEKPLPEDLRVFLDNSPQGIVYFSLGSISNSSTLSENLKNSIVEAFRELPFNVLFKWELDYLPDKPKNVMIKKWIPQQDVLRHKNVKVFVTQAGPLSIEEAILNCVPIVAIPLVLDQPMFAKKMIEMGIGKVLDYSTMTKESLKNAISGVAKSTRYREAIRKMKLLYQGQQKSLGEAVWWIEYVIRHKGAHHLKNLNYVSYYQYFMLNLFIIILATFIITVLIISLIIYVVRKLIN